MSGITSTRVKNELTVAADVIQVVALAEQLEKNIFAMEMCLQLEKGPEGTLQTYNHLAIVEHLVSKIRGHVEAHLGKETKDGSSEPENG